MAADRAVRHAEHAGGFFLREPAEEAHLDHARRLGVRGFEPPQRVVERQQRALVDRAAGRQRLLVERDALEVTAPFDATAGARVVDQDAPHHPARDGEEVRPVLPLAAGLVDQPDERLVDERGGLQGVRRVLAAHALAGDAPQVVVKRREQALRGLRGAAAGGQEQLGDVEIVGHGGVTGLLLSHRVCRTKQP